MENREVFVNEIIEKYLEENAVKSGVDVIKAKSLFRSCIETNEHEMTRAIAIIMDKKRPGCSYSVKLKNIKINLRFALDVIFGISGVIESSNIALVLSLLDVINEFFSDATVSIDENKTFLLYSIYKLDYNNEGVDFEQVYNYVKNNAIESIKDKMKDMYEFEEELADLAELNCIEIKKDKIFLNEYICV